MAFEDLIRNNGDLIIKSLTVVADKDFGINQFHKEETGTAVIFTFRPSFTASDWYYPGNNESFGEIKMNRKEYPCMVSFGNDVVDATVNEAFMKKLEALVHPTTSFHKHVQEAVDKNQKIVFTGYSSGGAIAILATVWYLQTHFKQNQTGPNPLCITFGAPLVGDSIFKHALGRENWSQFFINFVSRFDIIPRISLAKKSSISQTLPQILHLLEDPRVSIPGNDQNISKFYATVLRDTANVAYQSFCDLAGNGEAFLQTLSSFLKLSPYRPVGTFVFLTETNMVSVNNSDAILQILFYSSQAKDEQEEYTIPYQSISDHKSYKGLSQSMGSKQFNHLDGNGLDTDSIKPVLNDLGLSPRARECVRAAFKAEEQKLENQKKMDSKQPIIEEKLKWIVEEYKTRCETRRVDYYDSFKASNEENDFQANVNRVELAAIYDEVLGLLKKGKLPDGFEGRKVTVDLATRYRRLIEPLDIANYHRHLKNEDTGPYMDKGRPNRYKYAQRWYEHEQLKQNGQVANKVFWDKVTGLNLGSLKDMEKEKEFAGSCFWSEVEELMGKPYETIKVRVKTLEAMIQGWMDESEIEKQIFLQGSTYRNLWDSLPREHKNQSPVRNYML